MTKTIECLAEYLHDLDSDRLGRPEYSLKASQEKA